LTTPTRDDTKAPRWLVRWLITLVLFLVIAGIGYVIYWQVTFPDRMEAHLHQLNCEMAQREALSESDPTKANLLLAAARLVCQ
jgi:hypothetical protein